MTIGFSGDTLATLRCSMCDYERVVEMEVGDTFGMFIDRVLVHFASKCPNCGASKT